MGTAVRNERGSILFIAVIGMLIMGILGASFALLARLEATMGVEHTNEVRAGALAEAGLDLARDAVRAAAARTGGFTPWLGGPLLASGPLGAGQYWARIDNDCAPLVPSALQEAPACDVGGPDANETAVVTAWAQAGTGRSRIRALVAVDTAWQHVCSGATPDYTGPCQILGAMGGSPVVSPADPADPNGPAAFDELPRPTLGCSAIDPTLHGETPASCPPGTLWDYPSYPAGTRLVVMGDRTRQNCDGGGIEYAGYFDCALTTPCDPAVDSCPGGSTKGCVRPGDTRATTDPSKYAVANPACPTAATGMVLNYYGAAGRDPAPVAAQDPSFGNVGSSGNGRNLYVLNRGGHGQVTVQNATVHGMLVVEGNGSSGCDALGRDVVLSDNGGVRAQPANVAHGRPVYGYALALLVYDPTQAAPTIAPRYAPQATCADLGGSNAGIDGLVYSGGRVQLNPISVNGGVVALELRTSGGNDVRLVYNAAYRGGTPPAGFLANGGSRVVMIRKSVAVCAHYNDESGAATTCN